MVKFVDVDNMARWIQREGVEKSSPVWLATWRRITPSGSVSISFLALLATPVWRHRADADVERRRVLLQVR